MFPIVLKFIKNSHRFLVFIQNWCFVRKMQMLQPFASCVSHIAISYRRGITAQNVEFRISLLKESISTSPFIAQKMKFFMKDFFSKCDQIRSYLQIWSHLLKKSLMENFIFCAVSRKTLTKIRVKMRLSQVHLPMS